MVRETLSAKLEHLLLITKAGTNVKGLDGAQRTTYNNAGRAMEYDTGRPPRGKGVTCAGGHGP
jgi:hypothetical protein